jgi:hypothetical protein
MGHGQHYRDRAMHGFLEQSHASSMRVSGGNAQRARQPKKASIRRVVRKLTLFPDFSIQN